MLHCALESFEKALAVQAGPFRYRDGTMNFVLPQIESWRTKTLRELKPDFALVSDLRNWLHHHSSWWAGRETTDKALAAMTRVLRKVQGIRSQADASSSRSDSKTLIQDDRT